MLIQSKNKLEWFVLNNAKKSLESARVKELLEKEDTKNILKQIKIKKTHLHNKQNKNTKKTKSNIKNKKNNSFNEKTRQDLVSYLKKKELSINTDKLNFTKDSLILHKNNKKKSQHQLYISNKYSFYTMGIIAIVYAKIFIQSYFKQRQVHTVIVQELVTNILPTIQKKNDSLLKRTLNKETMLLKGEEITIFEYINIIDANFNIFLENIIRVDRTGNILKELLEQKVTIENKRRTFFESLITLCNRANNLDEILIFFKNKDILMLKSLLKQKIQIDDEITITVFAQAITLKDNYITLEKILFFLENEDHSILKNLLQQKIVKRNQILTVLEYIINLDDNYIALKKILNSFNNSKKSVLMELKEYTLKIREYDDWRRFSCKFVLLNRIITDTLESKLKKVVNDLSNNLNSQLQDMLLSTKIWRVYEKDTSNNLPALIDIIRTRKDRTCCAIVGYEHCIVMLKINNIIYFIDSLQNESDLAIKIIKMLNHHNECILINTGFQININDIDKCIYESVKNIVLTNDYIRLNTHITHEMDFLNSAILKRQRNFDFFRFKEYITDNTKEGLTFYLAKFKKLNNQIDYKGIFNDVQVEKDIYIENVEEVVPDHYAVTIKEILNNHFDPIIQNNEIEKNVHLGYFTEGNKIYNNYQKSKNNVKIVFNDIISALSQQKLLEKRLYDIAFNNQKTNIYLKNPEYLITSQLKIIKWSDYIKKFYFFKEININTLSFVITIFQIFNIKENYQKSRSDNITKEEKSHYQLEMFRGIINLLGYTNNAYGIIGNEIINFISHYTLSMYYDNKDSANNYFNQGIFIIKEQLYITIGTILIGLPLAKTITSYYTIKYIYNIFEIFFTNKQYDIVSNFCSEYKPFFMDNNQNKINNIFMEEHQKYCEPTWLNYFTNGYINNYKTNSNTNLNDGYNFIMDNYDLLYSNYELEEI